jgi:hypothetical protein
MRTATPTASAAPRSAWSGRGGALPASARRRALRAAGELLAAAPTFRYDPPSLAFIRQVLAQAEEQLEHRLAFEFMPGPLLRFKTNGGVWVPRCAAAGVALFMAYAAPGSAWPMVAPSIGAARGRLDRAIEALAAVDLTLANALALARGDARGCHLSSTRWPRIFLLRWQA